MLAEEGLGDCRKDNTVKEGQRAQGRRSERTSRMMVLGGELPHETVEGVRA